MGKQSEAVKRWRKKTKSRIIQAMGGKCCICGYNKCDEAMDLHHLDPTQKDFSFGKIRANAKSWNTIVGELRKCILLCCRCHREVHYGKTILPGIFPIFDETFTDYIVFERELKEQEKLSNYTPCLICGKLKPENLKTCSYNCSAKLAYKVDWDSINLLEMLKTKSRVKIAKELGVSDAAVGKRERKLRNI